MKKNINNLIKQINHRISKNLINKAKEYEIINPEIRKHLTDKGYRIK